MNHADLSMGKGANYPVGPLTWADAVGPATLARIIENLGAFYGEDRYRLAPLLRRRAGVVQIVANAGNTGDR